MGSDKWINYHWLLKLVGVQPCNWGLNYRWNVFDCGDWYKQYPTFEKIGWWNWQSIIGRDVHLARRVNVCGYQSRC